MKLLKLTGTSGHSVWVAPGKICAMERRDGTMTLIAFVGSATTTVTETPEAIAAMLAEPVALPSDGTPASVLTPQVLTNDGPQQGQIIVGGNAPLPRVSWHGLEPLDGACVRTLPTPQGARRFLCLPEVDLAKPVERDGWYAGVFGNATIPMYLYLCEGHQWNTAMAEPFEVTPGTTATAAFGPLPPVAP